MAVVDDSREFASLLNVCQYNHFVYREPEEKLLGVVVNGLPKEFKVEDIRKNFASHGFPVIDVYFIDDESTKVHTHPISMAIRAIPE